MYHLGSKIRTTLALPGWILLVDCPGQIDCRRLNIRTDIAVPMAAQP
jgi:hypothetical protein